MERDDQVSATGADRVGGAATNRPIARARVVNALPATTVDSHAIQIAFQPARRAIITRMRREHALSGLSLSLCARVLCPWRRRRTILFLQRGA